MIFFYFIIGISSSLMEILLRKEKNMFSNILFFARYVNILC